jgi:hypothetical protein
MASRPTSPINRRHTHGRLLRTGRKRPRSSPDMGECNLEDAVLHGLEEIAGRPGMTLSDRSAHAAADLVGGEQPGDSVQDGPRSRWRSRHAGFTPES